MPDKKITPQELKTILNADIDRLFEQVAQAINNAQAGRIINDSEELVRDANAEFRQRLYQKALDLLQDQRLQEDFSPSANRTEPNRSWRNKGRQKTSCMTVNGLVEFERTILWNSQRGSVAPLDVLLGIIQERYSAGVREMACRLSLNTAFVPACENLARTAQLRISHSALRQLVEREGRRAEQSIRGQQYGPNWRSENCTDQTVITGADGVMVPLVTDEQKKKRRTTELARQQRQGCKSPRKRGRPKSGSDGPYQEFKVVSFYDPDKSHKYALGTSGRHHVLGRMMRREAAKIQIGRARVKYSVSDGAEWIARQYNIHLPMLDENILDYYHLRDHVIAGSHILYGEGTAKAQAWREEMMGYVWDQGSLVLLDRLSSYLRCHGSGPKGEALKSLRAYVGKRVNMTDYPSYRKAGYDCGSGPTESFCGTLTARLKGRGMRWDKDNAEAIMALGSLYYSNLWSDYWDQQRAA